LLGVPDDLVTKDRLYRTLDALLAAKEPIEQDLKERLGELFSLQFDLLLCDLTSSFFEGLMEGSELAKRGHSRDHRPDCKQIVLALIVTPDGFPVYHKVFAGNTNDAVAFPGIVETMELRFGKARRVWVLDRGIASQKNLDFLRERNQSFLVGTPRSRLGEFDEELCTRMWRSRAFSAMDRPTCRPAVSNVAPKRRPFASVSFWGFTKISRNCPIAYRPAV
jgi:transposase